MRRLNSIWQQGKSAFCTLAGWLLLHNIALAQGQPQGEQSSGGTYVVSYMLVLLGVGLGLLVVCRPSGRRDRARPEQYEEGKLADAE